MSLFKRIGTQRHKYKMEFFIKKITFNKTLKGSVYITIKRGDHKATTEQQVPFQDKVCNFKNEILTFPALTMFYDESQQRYQQKEGEIKVILKSNKGEKKLLGCIRFDVATYANNKSTKTFKQKIQLSQTPKSLQGVLSFQVYLEYMGQASETSKSIVKQQKSNRREQSPFNKIANFFSGLVGSDERQQINTNKGSSPKKNEEKDDQKYKIKGSRREKPSNDQIQQRSSRNEEQTIQSRKKKNQRKQDVQIDQQKDRRGRGRNIKTTSDQQSQLFNYKKKSLPKKQPAKKANKNNSKQEEQEGSGGVEEQPKKAHKKQKQRVSRQEEDIFNNNNSVQTNTRKPPKNLIRPEVPDSFTQVGEHQKVSSVHTKSQSKAKADENVDIFFDDPNTFPKEYKLVQENKSHKQAFLKEDKPQKHESAKPSKRVKENTLNIEPRKKREQNHGQVSNQSKTIGTDEEVKPRNDKKIKETEIKPNIQQKNKSSSNQFKKTQKDKKQQLFGEFAPPPIKQTYASPFQLNKKPPPTTQAAIEPKHQKADQEFKKKITQIERQNKTQIQKLKKQLQIKAKELEAKAKQLQSKTKQLQKMKSKNQTQQQLKNKLKQSEQRKKQLQKSNNQIKQALVKSQKEVNRLKSQNSTLKQQVDKNESFFRQTEQYYQQNNQVDFKEEIKKLQKQKNEHLLNLQKEREKNKKEVKQLNQQIEKAKEQFKEYEDLSKAELKKLKDQIMLKNGNIESFKDKLKQKSKEQQALLRENKLLNSANIDLKEKLQGLKIKICQKLNEANQNGESEVMEVLTQLNEQF